MIVCPSICRENKCPWSAKTLGSSCEADRDSRFEDIPYFLAITANCSPWFCLGKSSRFPMTGRPRGPGGKDKYFLKELIARIPRNKRTEIVSTRASGLDVMLGRAVRVKVEVIQSLKSGALRFHELACDYNIPE